MKLWLAFAAVVLVGGFGWWVISNRSQTPNSKSEEEVKVEKEETKYVFGTPKKSAHYESNTPEHGVVLAGVPVNVVIDFNFDLAKPSEIKILKDGQEYGEGETVIDTNKLAMRRKMKADAQDGLYGVEYKACWPDKSCHEGKFEFAIARSEAESFVDMRNKAEVTVDLKQFAFEQKLIRVSRGTKVTWTNRDEAEHYINTDAHPAHTYVKDMNSHAMKKGETYSYTFTTAGIYPYHCSAHTDMKAQVVVE